MDNAPTPSDLIAQRVRELRKARGMTVAALAERCKDAGAPQLTAQALYKLEGQRDKRSPRPVSVDEMLTLAYVLDIAPVHLIAGLDDDAAMPLGAGWTVDAAGARMWIRGLAPMRDRNRKLYEATVPPSETDTQWFKVDDVTSSQELAKALEGLRAFVSLQQQLQNEGRADG